VKKVIALFLALCLFSCHPNDRPAIKTGFEGKPLPAFSLLLIDSSTSFNTHDIPKGEPIVLLFFSPQCPFCRAEISDIIKNISTMSRVRFYLFTNWPFRTFKSFYSHYQLNKYPNIVAGQDEKNYFLNHFKTIGVPFTVVYTKDKILQKAFVGRMNADQIKEVVQIN